MSNPSSKQTLINAAHPVGEFLRVAMEIMERSGVLGPSRGYVARGPECHIMSLTGLMPSSKTNTIAVTYPRLTVDMSVFKLPLGGGRQEVRFGFRPRMAIHICIHVRRSYTGVTHSAAAAPGRFKSLVSVGIIVSDRKRLGPAAAARGASFIFAREPCPSASGGVVPPPVV